MKEQKFLQLDSQDAALPSFKDVINAELVQGWRVIPGGMALASDASLNCLMVVLERDTDRYIEVDKLKEILQNVRDEYTNPDSYTVHNAFYTDLLVFGHIEDDVHKQLNVDIRTISKHSKRIAELNAEGAREHLDKTIQRCIMESVKKYHIAVIENGDVDAAYNNLVESVQLLGFPGVDDDSDPVRVADMLLSNRAVDGATAMVDPRAPYGSNKP